MSDKDGAEKASPVMYECTCCQSEFEIEWKYHINPNYYVECDCGELGLPMFKSDLRTKNKGEQ